MTGVEDSGPLRCVACAHHIHCKHRNKGDLKLPLPANRRIQILAVSGNTSSPPQPNTGVSSLDLGRSLARTAFFSAPADCGAPCAGRAAADELLFRRVMAALQFLHFPFWHPRSIFCSAVSLGFAGCAAALLGRFLPRLGPSVPGRPLFLRSSACDALAHENKQKSRRCCRRLKSPIVSVTDRYCGPVHAGSALQHYLMGRGLQFAALQHRLMDVIPTGSQPSLGVSSLDLGRPHRTAPFFAWRVRARPNDTQAPVIPRRRAARGSPGSPGTSSSPGA